MTTFWRRAAQSVYRMFSLYFDLLGAGLSFGLHQFLVIAYHLLFTLGARDIFIYRITLYSSKAAQTIDSTNILKRGAILTSTKYLFLVLLGIIWGLNPMCDY